MLTSCTPTLSNLHGEERIPMEKVVDVSIFPPGTECLYGQNKQTEWVCKVAWS